MVNTGVGRELPAWARFALKLATPLLSLIMTGADETGARQLFTATSGLYPPAKPFSEFAASGITAPKDLKASSGVDGVQGSGAYLVSWNNEIVGKVRFSDCLSSKASLSSPFRVLMSHSW